MPVVLSVVRPRIIWCFALAFSSILLMALWGKCSDLSSVNGLSCCSIQRSGGPRTKATKGCADVF